MGKLVYTMNASLDGYVETVARGLDWARVDEELHTWFNDLERRTSVSLYGRRLYETMAAFWPTVETEHPDAPAWVLDFARAWNATPKVVFSRTLASVAWNSRLASGDPAEELARVRAGTDGEVGVGGATLAAAFLERGLVDEIRLLVHPVVLGAGRPFFPPLPHPVELRLLETRTFASGVVLLRYETS